MRYLRPFLLLCLFVVIGGAFARLFAKGGVGKRPSGAAVAGYTLVTGVGLGASQYCPAPGEAIQLFANLSGEGDSAVKVTIKTDGGTEITSCDAMPNGSCTANYTVPDVEGTVRITATAQGTRGDAKTSTPVTEVVVTRKQWRAEPALVPGELTAKGQAAPPTEPPTPSTPPTPPTEPPTNTPPATIPAGALRFAPGSTVQVGVAGASDKDICTRCGKDEPKPVADTIKYQWTQGGTGIESPTTVTLPDTEGASIQVAVSVDDEADLGGGAGSRDDAATSLTMTLYAASPDPNDPRREETQYLIP